MLGLVFMNEDINCELCPNISVLDIATHELLKEI